MVLGLLSPAALSPSQVGSPTPLYSGLTFLDTHLSVYSGADLEIYLDNHEEGADASV